MQRPIYEVGQVWSYRTRPEEPQSRLYIVRITDSDKLGSIYNIFLDGLFLKNPSIKGGVQDVLPHSPVSAETLDLSVTNLIETQLSELPEISEGYQLWREAFDRGEAGVFTIPVKQIIQYLEDIVNEKTGD